MGKKAKETIEEPSDTVKSLFGADNPFRRKSQPDPIAATAATTATATGTGSDLISHKAELGGDDIVEPRKRKRERGNPNPNPSPGSNLIPSKRKKLEDGNEGAKKRKKRKRDELEADYERSRYGKAEEDSKSDGEGEPDGGVVGEKRKAGKALSEIAVSKENFDNESKLLRTVFVGNLPLKTKKKTLLKKFASFGEIESVRIRSVPIVDTKTPRKSAIFKGKINDAIDSVHAYIVFKDEQSAHASLSHNMAEVGGNHIRVDMACPPRKKLKGEGPLYDRQRTVFVGNLPFDVKDEELYKLFCGPSQSESNVEAVRVIRDTHSSLGKGIAYVLFKTREAANSTARKRELKIRNRTLRLFHAKMTSGPEPKVNLPNKRTSSTGRSPSVKNDRPKGATTLSYQGLRSSKSGALKKASLHPPSTGGSGNYGNNGSSKRKMGPDENGRKFKRPAVAARKAKLQNKRKQESGSSESGHRNKKFRKN